MHAAAARAQRAARVPKVAGLFISKELSGTDLVVAGLKELGYVEGRTISFEWRWWEGKPELLRGASAELLALNPDVIVVGGSEATRAMKEATRSIPIVFIGPSYPVEEGLVASFARPGGNVTGVSVAMSDYVTKLLQLLQTATVRTCRYSGQWLLPLSRARSTSQSRSCRQDGHRRS